MISVNSIIGSIVYRTAEALTANEPFMSELQKYPYWRDTIVGGKFNFWHYPGTFNEIASTLLNASNLINGAKLKFPSLFNFQPIEQIFDSGKRTAVYNLAFIAKTDPAWSTEDREKRVFETLLRPLVAEFLNQVKKSKFFDIEYNGPSYRLFEIFTTGNNKGVLQEQYGDHIDAIEIHGFKIAIRDICSKSVIERIISDNNAVTDRINQTINS